MARLDEAAYHAGWLARHGDAFDALATRRAVGSEQAAAVLRNGWDT